MKQPKHYKISTIIIPKKLFNEEQAIDFVKEHFKYKKIRETKKSYFFRQTTPAHLKKLGYTNYKTTKLPNGIDIVIGYHTDIKGGEISVQHLTDFVNQGYDNKNRKDIDDFILDTSISTDENQVYHNPITNQTVVNLRGTEGTIKDWGNNLYGAVGLYKYTDRYQRAQKIKNEAIAKYGKISITSHSQGNFSGKEFAKDKNVTESISLNPAGFSKLGEKEHVVRSNKDIVSLPTAILNKGNKNITTVKSKLPLLNPYNLAKYIINQHSTKILGKVDNTTKIGSKYRR